MKPPDGPVTAVTGRAWGFTRIFARMVLERLGRADLPDRTSRPLRRDCSCIFQTQAPARTANVGNTARGERLADMARSNPTPFARALTISATKRSDSRRVGMARSARPAA